MDKDKRIKGVNLGGWLLMEDYNLGGRNIAESRFKRDFKKEYGEKGLRDFTRLFRDNFIREEDFKNISLMGANALRVPFNFRLIEPGKPFVYSEEGFSYLEKVLSWGKKYNLGIILDLHAACGAQNCDWHGDSLGPALFWDKESYRERTCCLWERIAERFKDAPALIGYDLLNEPVIGKRSQEILVKFYRQAIKRVKAVDKKHLLFLEGNNWAQEVESLRDLLEENISISIHTYAPLEYTFNFTPFYKFPGIINGIRWDSRMAIDYLRRYAEFSAKNKVRIFVGEFGINWRGGFWGELEWLESILKAFREFGFDYTYWTYKAISQHAFPDGIYQYIQNNDYIKRQGELFGWENYLKAWKGEKGKIVEFWRTKNYTPNRQIISVLKKYFK